MSSMIKLVKDLPGVRAIRRARYARFFKNSQDFNLFHGIYGDFAAASASAPSNKVLGYDHEEPAALYEEFFHKLNSSDFPALYWLERLGENVSSIYDFGGHVGIKYYAYTRTLSRAKSLRWTTYDLPSVISRGRTIAATRGEEALEFSESVADLKKGYDLLFASGSLQYLEDPISLLLGSLKNHPRYLLINMVPLHETESFVTLQNIGPAFCPYKVFRKSDFLAQIESFGYRLVSEWVNPDKKCEVPFHDQHSVYGYTGLLFEKF